MNERNRVRHFQFIFTLRKECKQRWKCRNDIVIITIDLPFFTAQELHVYYITLCNLTKGITFKANIVFLCGTIPNIPQV